VDNHPPKPRSSCRHLLSVSDRSRQEVELTIRKIVQSVERQMQSSEPAGLFELHLQVRPSGGAGGNFICDISICIFQPYAANARHRLALAKVDFLAAFAYNVSLTTQALLARFFLKRMSDV